MKTIEISDKAYAEIDDAAKRGDISHAQVIDRMIKKVKEYMRDENRRKFINKALDGEF
jgi:predicted CopG family antitoxin